MSCAYISSNDNRFYVGLETAYGQAPAIDSRNRFPAVKLAARQRLERPERRDKTGSRTYPGAPAGARKQTTYELRTYMTAWTRLDSAPGYGPLFESGLGGAPQFFLGGTAGTSASAKLLTFSTPHSLTAGQAVTFGGELRFVSSIVDAMTVELNAPLTVIPAAGSPSGPAVTYHPTSSLGTVSLFD